MYMFVLFYYQKSLDRYDRNGVAYCSGTWRWTLTHQNGRIVGASTEGYKKRAMCFKNFTLVTGFFVPKTLMTRKKSEYRLKLDASRRATIGDVMP